MDLPLGFEDGVLMGRNRGGRLGRGAGEEWTYDPVRPTMASFWPGGMLRVMFLRTGLPGLARGWGD